MTQEPNSPISSEEAEMLLRALSEHALRPETFKPLDDRIAPRFDESARTVFLRLTTARALTPKAKIRVNALRILERLVAKQVSRGWIGIEGHMLGTLANKYPVSHRAIRAELRGMRVQNLVEAAEQIELRLWLAPQMRRPRSRPADGEADHT